MSFKRAVIAAFGGPENLQIVQEPNLPEPNEGEVRVRVLAAGVAFTDVMIRKGMYAELKTRPPFTPGYDMVGVVDKVGKGVSAFKEGDRVADLTVTGSHAEYICLPESRLVRAPNDIDPTKAVSVVLAYVTAFQLLRRMTNVRGNEVVLVHGAAGAVGTALLQLGNLLGLRMYGSDIGNKTKTIAELGATPIDCQQQDFVQVVKNQGGAHVVLDPIGGENLKRSFRALKTGGILVGYGFYNAVLGKSGNIPLDFIRIKLWNTLPNGRSSVFYSIGALRKKHPEWFKKDLYQLFDWLKNDKIKPVIAKELPLDQIRHAHQLIESGKPTGKVVLRIGY